MTDANIPSQNERKAPNIGAIVPVTHPEALWDIAKPESRRLSEIVGLHEASGVDVRFDPDIEEGRLYHATRQRIYPDDDNFTPSFLFFRDTKSGILADLEFDPGDNNHTSVCSQELNEWLWNSDWDSDTEPYDAGEPEDIAILEKFVGSVFIRISGEAVSRYIPDPHVEIAELGDIQRLFIAPDLTSSILNGGDVDEIEDDPLLDHVFDEARYVIVGQSGERQVSRSTLAIIDASVQIAQLTGETSLPLSVVLAQVYDPELFCEDLETPYYDRYYKSMISNQDVLKKVVAAWTSEMGVETDNLLREVEGDIYELLQFRQINLTWLTQEYGHVNSVRKINPATSEALIRVGIDSLPVLKDQDLAPNGSELIASLSEPELRNLSRHSEVILDVIENMSLLYRRGEVAPEDILNKLDNDGIVSSDVARTHADEFIGLISEYQTLLVAKRSMEQSGLDTGSMGIAFQAKLIEFVARNAAAVQRTNILAPEIGMNLDTMLTIVERTRMQGRDMGEVVGVLGRIAAAKEQIEAALFPELVISIRKLVIEEMQIEQLPVTSNLDDNSGATFYVSSESEADSIASAVNEILSTSSIMTDEIPVEVKFVPQSSAISRKDGKTVQSHWLVSIGTPKQKGLIPEEQHLEAGPGRYWNTQTGGH